MLLLFAIVVVLIFELGSCILFFHLMDARSYRRLINKGLRSIF